MEYIDRVEERRQGKKFTRTETRKYITTDRAWLARDSGSLSIRDCNSSDLWETARRTLAQDYAYAAIIKRKGKPSSFSFFFWLSEFWQIAQIQVFSQQLFCAN